MLRLLNDLVDGVVVVELDEAETALSSGLFFGQMLGHRDVAVLRFNVVIVFLPSPTLRTSKLDSFISPV
jgi:hypothetical protein